MRRERQLRGISLAEIARATKISPRLLEALEDDEFGLLPQPVYSHAFVRAYARQLGIDEQETLDRFLFEASRAGRLKPAGRMPDAAPGASPLARLGGTALAAAVVLLLLWLIIGHQAV